MEIGNLVHAFFDTAGPGGVVVLLVIGTACLTYYYLTRWILKGNQTAAQSKQHKNLREQE